MSIGDLKSLLAGWSSTIWSWAAVANLKGDLQANRFKIYGTSPIVLNAGTDPKKFPSTGVSTLHVLKQFHALGPNCFFSKQDWSDAYKHIIVRTEDLRLQCVGFLGKILCKGSLTFGASSSPSIFYRLSEIQRVLACLRSSMCRASCYH